MTTVVFQQVINKYQHNPTIKAHYIYQELVNIYRKVATCDTSRLEAQAGFFRLLMKGIFDPYVL